MGSPAIQKKMKNIPIIPILKPSKARRCLAESSDDWIEFAPEENIRSSIDEDSYDDDSTSSEDDEDFVIDKSSIKNSDGFINEQKRCTDQKDSGFEEKRVSWKMIYEINENA